MMGKKTNSILIGIGILVVVAIVSFIELRGEDVIPVSKTSFKADYYDTYDGAIEAILGKKMTELQKLNGKTIEIAFDHHYLAGLKDGRILMGVWTRKNLDGSLTNYIIRFDNTDFENDKKADELYNLAKDYKSILISVRGKCFVNHTRSKGSKGVDDYDIKLTNAQVTNIFSYKTEFSDPILNKSNKITYQDYIMNIPQEKYLRNAF